MLGLLALALVGVVQGDTAAPVAAWVARNELAQCAIRHVPKANEPAFVEISRQVGDARYLIEFSDRTSWRFRPSVGMGRLVAGSVWVETLADFVAGRDGRTNAIMGVDERVVRAMGDKGSFRMESATGSNWRLGPVAVPNLSTGLALLQGCERAQLIAWGADAAQFAPGGRPPSGFDAGNTLSQRERARLLTGLSNVDLLTVLTVSPTGTVEGCDMTFVPAGNAAEARICGALAGRHVATPARDAAGRAVRGVVTFHPSLMRRSAF